MINTGRRMHCGTEEGNAAQCVVGRAAGGKKMVCSSNDNNFSAAATIQKQRYVDARKKRESQLAFRAHSPVTSLTPSTASTAVTCSTRRPATPSAVKRKIHAGAINNQYSHRRRNPFPAFLPSARHTLQQHPGPADRDLAAHPGKTSRLAVHHP